MSDIEARETVPSADASAGPAKQGGRMSRLFGRRRKFLVNPRHQFRVGIVAAAVVLALLILLNVSLYFTSGQSSDAFLRVAPELEEYVRSQERVQLNLILLGSVVFLAGTFLVAVLESHRTAGAAFNLSRRLREIQAGRFSTRLVLRKGDNLRELEPVFNEMAEALKQRTLLDVEEIRNLATRAATINDEACRTLASDLLAIAEKKLERLE
jgi:hypothetical protein